MSAAARLLAVLLLWATAAGAGAHEGSTSYLSIDARQNGASVNGRWDIALIDLAWNLPLDVDGNGRLDWNEIQARQSAIAALLGGGLVVTRGGRPCNLQFGEPWLTNRLGIPYLSVDLTAACAAPAPIGIASRLFFDSDDTHRVLVAVSEPGVVHAATLSPASRSWTEPAQPSAWRTAFSFLGQGLWHVWTGYDHLVFLLLLLLPSVVRREPSRDRGRGIALDLARIVTTFTVAHSVTLGLAATAVLRAPQRPIEIAIALSLIVAGLLNLAPRLARLRLPLAFGFGLVHGFGFANALAGLDTGGASVLPVLAGFNFGVELANLCVIAAVLPLLLWSGRFAWYGPRAVPALSLASAALGAAWMIQRV